MQVLFQEIYSNLLHNIVSNAKSFGKTILVTKILESRSSQVPDKGAGGAGVGQRGGQGPGQAEGRAA